VYVKLSFIKVTKTCIQFNKIKVFIRTQSFNYSKRLLINYQTIKNSTKILQTQFQNYESLKVYLSTYLFWKTSCFYINIFLE
jgi:hypothetical protein